MRLFLTIAALTLIASVTALPALEVIPRSEPQFPLLDPGMTISEAASKCGDQAQLSCCGHAVKAGDQTSVDEGIASGLLSNLGGGGSGTSVLHAFDQCSKLDVQVAVLIVLAQDLLNQHCKQNVACCQKSAANSSASGVAASLSCVALGSVL